MKKFEKAGFRITKTLSYKNKGGPWARSWAINIIFNIDPRTRDGEGTYLGFKKFWQAFAIWAYVKWNGRMPDGRPVVRIFWEGYQ